jgi:hypothetical protein
LSLRLPDRAPRAQTSHAHLLLVSKGNRFFLYLHTFLFFGVHLSSFAVAVAGDKDQLRLASHTIFFSVFALLGLNMLVYRNRPEFNPASAFRVALIASFGVTALVHFGHLGFFTGAVYIMYHSLAWLLLLTAVCFLLSAFWVPPTFVYLAGVVLMLDTSIWLILMAELVYGPGAPGYTPSYAHAVYLISASLLVLVWFGATGEDPDAIRMEDMSWDNTTRKTKAATTRTNSTVRRNSSRVSNASMESVTVDGRVGTTKAGMYDGDMTQM